MEQNSAIDEIVKRCSKYSGWDLIWDIKDDVLNIWDPKDPGKSRLSVMLWRPGSTLLMEVYGRLRHWNISLEERQVLACALGKNS